MFLFDLPDEVLTAENVDDFLSSQINRMERLSGVSLSSPQLSLAPAHSSGVNSQEKMMERRLAAFDVLKAIKYAIDHTSGVSPQILFEFYVLHKKVWEINRDCNMNHNQFGDFKNVALNQFAECWISAQDKYFPDEADRFDLQIYPGETLADAGWRADQTTRKRKNGM